MPLCTWGLSLPWAQGSPLLGFCSGLLSPAWPSPSFRLLGFAAVCFLLLLAAWSWGGVARRRLARTHTSQQDVGPAPVWSWRAARFVAVVVALPRIWQLHACPHPGRRGQLGHTEGILLHPCWLPAVCRTLSRTSAAARGPWDALSCPLPSSSSASPVGTVSRLLVHPSAPRVFN